MLCCGGRPIGLLLRCLTKAVQLIKAWQLAVLLVLLLMRLLILLLLGWYACTQVLLLVLLVLLLLLWLALCPLRWLSAKPSGRCSLMLLLLLLLAEAVLMAQHTIVSRRRLQGQLRKTVTSNIQALTATNTALVGLTATLNQRCKLLRTD